MLIRTAIVGVLMALCLTPAKAATPENDYCIATGGRVITRIPAFGTNGGTPLILANPKAFCDYFNVYQQTHIEVETSTLFATQPSLAALAYYAKVKPHLKKCRGNPASCYCSQLGGTDEFGGITIAGGGWVNAQNVNDVGDMCTFPDLSMIDAWGLTYHAVGTIRGTDLGTVLKYANPYAPKK